MLQRYAATQRAQLDARPATRKLHRTAAAGVAGAAAGAVVGFDGAGFVGAASGGGGGGGGGGRPVVSVCVCTTSRNTDFNTLGQLVTIQTLALPHNPLHPLTTPCTTPCTPGTPPLHPPPCTPALHPRSTLSPLHAPREG